MIPTFSLCHATARLPNGWRPAYETWRLNADNWPAVEYILCVDTADREKWPSHLELVNLGIILTENTDRQCAADAWNQSGRLATGKVMVTAADDCFPPPHWDTELLRVIPDLDGEYAVEVKSGTGPADDEWARWMLHSIITKKYYGHIGNFFCPEYEGMYADIDFTEMARRDGVVIDARRLTFQHRHWIGTTVPFDEIYQRQNAQARYDRGNAILGGRRVSNFANANRGEPK